MLEDFFTNPRASRPTQIFRGLLTLLVCGGFLAAILYEAWRTARVGEWPEVPCTILTSRVTEKRDASHEDKPYVFELAYAYEFAGGRYRGKEFSPDYSGSDMAAEAYALADAYPAGLRTTCRVNPAKHAESRLREASGVVWILVVCSVTAFCLPLILLYAIPQIAGRPYTWALGPLGPIVDHAWNGKTLSHRRSNGEMLIAALFCLALLAASGWWGVRPILTAARAAATWTPTPCRILSSLVAKQEIHGQHHVTLFRADVLYRYTAAGRERTSNAHTAWDGQSPFYAAGKRAITLDHPPGTTATCYVNPADPTEALLDTAPSPAMLLALTPGLFALILALWLLGEIRGSPRTPKACALLSALVGSAATGLLFVVTTLDTIHNWRAGYPEYWGALVALLMLTAFTATSYASARGRMAYRDMSASTAPLPQPRRGDKK